MNVRASYSVLAFMDERCRCHIYLLFDRHVLISSTGAKSLTPSAAPDLLALERTVTNAWQRPVEKVGSLREE